MKYNKQKFALELLEHITEFGVHSVALNEDGCDAITAFIKENDTNHVAIVQATAQGLSTTYLTNSAALALKEVIG